MIIKNSSTSWISIGFVLVNLVFVLLLMNMTSESTLAQSSAWSRPVNISNTDYPSWFPDLAIDSLGNVQVVWCETGEMGESLYYAVRKGQGWSAPNDIVPPSPNIIRNAIAIDRNDVLHLTFRHPATGSYAIYYKRAATAAAWSAATWSPPHLVSVRGSSYASDLAIDGQGTLHLLYDDLGDRGSEVCSGCGDIFYRRSKDGGQTWSPITNLSRSPTGSSRAQIEIDAADVIHVTWDEGWDRITGQGEPISSTYTFSMDGGETWTSSLSIAYPMTRTVQLTPASDGRGGVMLVWRNVITDGIYYQWSTDAGATWSEPAAIPGVLARPWANNFDTYDMAADSAGHIHLVAVGRDVSSRDIPASDISLGVYHLEWDGVSWSPAEKIFERTELFPEYPKIAISEGNRLNVVWFTRDDLWQLGNYEVWFSSSRSAAPHQTPMPTFTPTPLPTAQPPPSPTPTATPLFDAAVLQQPRSSTFQVQDLYTESDEIVLLILALSPLALIVVGILVCKRGLLRR